MNQACYLVEKSQLCSQIDHNRHINDVVNQGSGLLKGDG